MNSPGTGEANCATGYGPGPRDAGERREAARMEGGGSSERRATSGVRRASERECVKRECVERRERRARESEKRGCGKRRGLRMRGIEECVTRERQRERREPRERSAARAAEVKNEERREPRREAGSSRRLARKRVARSSRAGRRGREHKEKEVTWQIGRNGERVGEAKNPGPPSSARMIGQTRTSGGEAAGDGLADSDKEEEQTEQRNYWRTRIGRETIWG